MLEANAKEAGIGQIFYGASLTTMFNAPGVPTVPGPCCQLRTGGDPARPISSWRRTSVSFTPASAKKQSEHGGFAHDDTNVMLLVSTPNITRPAWSPALWKRVRWLRPFWSC